jgi:hypothetical protein
MRDKHQFWSSTKNKIKVQFSIHTNKPLEILYRTQKNVLI